MAKISKQTMEKTLYRLVDDICASMPSSTYKFLIGGAAGMLSLSNQGKLGELLGIVSDESGMVDTDAIRKIYTAAFNASGGKVQMQLFDKPGSILGAFVKPVTLTISLEDVEKLMSEAESTAQTQTQSQPIA